METFWKLFEKNVVISGVLALGFGAATIYLAITGQAVPDYLGAATTMILGYFFGAGKAQTAVNVLRSR